MAGSIKISRSQPEGGDTSGMSDAERKARDQAYADEYNNHQPADLRTAAEKKAEENKKRLLAALDLADGLIYIACRACGLDTSTHHNYYKNDPAYKADVDELINHKIDVIEANVITKIKSENEQVSLAASKLYLAAKAKHRGYGSEQRDLKHSGTVGVVARVVTYLPDNGRGAKLPDTTVPPEDR